MLWNLLKNFIFSFKAKWVSIVSISAGFLCQCLIEEWRIIHECHELSAWRFNFSDLRFLHLLHPVIDIKVSFSGHTECFTFLFWMSQLDDMLLYIFSVRDACKVVQHLRHVERIWCNIFIANKFVSTIIARKYASIILLYLIPVSWEQCGDVEILHQIVTNKISFSQTLPPVMQGSGVEYCSGISHQVDHL